MRSLNCALVAALLFAGVADTKAAVDSIDDADVLEDATYSGIDWTNNDFTVSGWAYFDNATGTGHERLLEIENGTGNSQRFLVYRPGGTDDLCIYAKGCGINQSSCDTTTGYGASTYYFWVITYDSDGTGGDLKLYVDDMSTAVGTLTCTAEFTADPTHLSIGNDGGSNTLDGDLAYVRLWQRVLTQSELEDEQDGAVMCDTTSAISDYRFASGALGTDSYGSHTLTVTGPAYTSNEPTATGCPSAGGSHTWIYIQSATQQ